MWFVVLGVILSALKLFSIGPVAAWSWFLVLAPFLLAVAWWKWADASGLTERKAMKRLDDRKASRRDKALEALGQFDPNKKRK